MIFRRYGRGAAHIVLSELAWVLLWYCPTVLMGWLSAGEDLGWFVADPTA
jgi:hypothetical protein